MKAKGNEQSIVNGARQKKKKKWSLPGHRTRVAGSVVGVLNHYTTNTSWKKRMVLYMLCRFDVPVLSSSIKIHKVAV
jgi:hypothetical protein